MIREIINFTENLIEDIPDIMQWKVQPSKGLHVFIEIDEKGQWINHPLQKGIDFDYYDGKNIEIKLWDDCMKFIEVSDYITMDKVGKFDKKKKIHSCSPFAVAFNFNFNDEDKRNLGIRKWGKGEKPTAEQKKENEALIRLKRIEIIKSRLNDYKKNAKLMFFGDNTQKKKQQNLSDILQKQTFKFDAVIEAFYSQFDKIIEEIQKTDEYQVLIDKDYLRIYLKSVSYEVQREYYFKYFRNEIFNDEKLTVNELGVVGFKNTFANKKPFLQHKTSSLIKGINQRLSREDALVLNKFEKLIKRKVLPNPLPIIVDKRELNKEIVKIFNDEKEPITYRQLLIKLFQKTNEKYFPDYYLFNYMFNYTNSKDGLIINDLDFVPSFHFYLNEIINNYTELSGKPSSKTISNLFEVESELNDLFVKYNNNTGKAHGFLMGNYFGDKIESQKSFKGWTVTKETLSSFYKYRESIYDFIYKSRRQSITCGMFDDMVYSAILSDINMDEYKNERHSMFYPVREKINIWFSIYNLFNNNNLIGNDMASKVTELISKMSSVAKGETNLETPEDFAFGAGQIVSYLIDRSASSNKTYAMLEPYLQKNKSNQLQDAIAQTIAIYKHDIGVYKGKFERLASQVLTDESNIEMKPLLKYFLAGCFCPCVVYEKTEKTENENNN